MPDNSGNRVNECTFPAPCSDRTVESIGVWSDGDLTIDTVDGTFIVDYRDLEPALQHRERLLAQEAADNEAAERAATCGHVNPDNPFMECDKPSGHDFYHGCALNGRLEGWANRGA